MNTYTITATNGDALHFYPFYSGDDESAVREAQRLTAMNRESAHKGAEAWHGRVMLTKGGKKQPTLVAVIA